MHVSKGLLRTCSLSVIFTFAILASTLCSADTLRDILTFDTTVNPNGAAQEFFINPGPSHLAGFGCAPTLVDPGGSGVRTVNQCFASYFSEDASLVGFNDV